MKNSIKKFVVACSAVAAVSVAFSMSAMAADEFSAAYTADGNSLAVTLPAIASGTEATVLVAKGEAITDSITDADIVYINQAAGGDFDGKTGDAETLLLKGESLADGTYVVAVGYNNGTEFTVVDDTFTVGGSSTDTHEVLMGDVTIPNGMINAADAQQVAKYAAKYEVAFASDPDKKLAADVTQPVGMINAADAQQIAKYAAKYSVTSNVGKTAIVDSEYNITGYKEAE